MNNYIAPDKPKVYTLPERQLFNSKRVMFAVSLIFVIMIVIFASSRG